jgi:membrane protein YdbS with pleckstrin-like domain
MPAKTIREAMLRRKRLFTTIEVSWVLLGAALALFAVQAHSLTSFVRLTMLVIAALLYVSGLLFIPSRWLRCPRCEYPFGKLSIRKKKTLQINVCPHCGQALDAPLDAARAP